MKNLIVTLKFLVIILYSVAWGQNRMVNYQNHGWYMYFGSYYWNSKMGLHAEYQWRRNEWIRNWQQSLGRVGLIYKLNNEVSFTLGYGNIITYPYGKQPVTKTFLEHRLWEQVLLSSKIKKWDIKHRYRLEQRWIENYPQWKFLNRFRYQLWLDIPFSTVFKKNLMICTFYDEVFINFGKNVQKNLLDQNRLYGAIGLVINPSTIIRIGYMNHILMKSDGIHEEMNHTLQISLHQNLTFKKSKD